MMRLLSIALICAGLALANESLQAAPLDSTFAAHGGLETWKKQGTLEYDLDLQFGERATQDHQRFDLVNRNGLITSTRYALGFDGSKLWLDTTEGNGPPMPPRFYLWTPFYFFGIPFVLGDPGVVLTPQPAAKFQGKTYDVIKVTYSAGVGDAPDDYYIVYIDPDTKRVKLARYIVTYFAKAAGKPTTGLPESVIVYDTWQTVSGLSVPKRASFYQWAGNTLGEAKGTMHFANVRFYAGRPAAEVFAAPATAVIVP